MFLKKSSFYFKINILKSSGISQYVNLETCFLCEFDLVFSCSTESKYLGYSQHQLK